MDIPPGAILFIAFGLVDIAAGLWAYLGDVEEHGAPRGFRNIARTWHGRGSVCAAIPAGFFFMMLGLVTIVQDDTLRRAFAYVGGLALLTAIFFLVRAPKPIQPAWMRAKSASTGPPPPADGEVKAAPGSKPGGPQV